MITHANAPIRVLLADDEPLARRGMEQLLESHADCQIVAACRNGREAVRALQTARPDVAFLDIQMPGLDGFRVLENLDPAAIPVIIFVTAYDEFAVRAFEQRALDYLLKPVSQTRFDHALDRVRERLQADRALRMTRDLAALFSTDANPGAAARPRSAGVVIVPTPTGDLVVEAEEIDWIRAQDYCAVVHAGGRRHVIRESLASLERRLDSGFVRIHRSAIVRLGRIRELRTTPAGSGVVLLRDGTRLPVSRRRRARVAAMLRSR